MAWNHHTLATGSRDRAILLRDVRSQEPYVAKLAGHRSEVRLGGGGWWAVSWQCVIGWWLACRRIVGQAVANTCYGC